MKNICNKIGFKGIICILSITFAAQAISLPIRFQRQSQMIPFLTFVVIRHDLNECVIIAQVLRVTVLSNSSHEKIIAQVNQEEI